MKSNTNPRKALKRDNKAGEQTPEHEGPNGDWSRFYEGAWSASRQIGYFWITKVWDIDPANALQVITYINYFAWTGLQRSVLGGRKPEGRVSLFPRSHCSLLRKCSCGLGEGACGPGPGF